MAITDNYLPYSQQNNSGYSFSTSAPMSTGLAAVSSLPDYSNALSQYSPDALKGILTDTSYSPAQLTSFAQGLGTDVASLRDSAGLETSLWDDTKGLLSNENFMTGALGVGQLGLGLANYLQMKPLYEEQLKGLKQNRQFAAENQQNRKNIASDLGG